MTGSKPPSRARAVRSWTNRSAFSAVVVPGTYTVRLEAAGFEVQLDLAEDVDPATNEKYGLLADENVFFCTKP